LRPVLAEELGLRPVREDDGAAQLVAESIDRLGRAVADVDRPAGE
jgi:hypothetical protein